MTNVTYLLYKSDAVIVTESCKGTYNVMFHNFQHGRNDSFAKLQDWLLYGGWEVQNKSRFWKQNNKLQTQMQI